MSDNETKTTVCPTCGRCPTCGHQHTPVVPVWPWYPTYPIYPVYPVYPTGPLYVPPPQITWTVTCGTSHTAAPNVDGHMRPISTEVR